MIILQCIAVISAALMFHAIWHKDDWRMDDSWRSAGDKK